MADLNYNFDSSVEHTEQKSWWANTGIYLLGIALILLFVALIMLILRMTKQNLPFVNFTEVNYPLPDMKQAWVAPGDTIYAGAVLGSMEDISQKDYEHIVTLIDNPKKIKGPLRLGSFEYQPKITRPRKKMSEEEVTVFTTQIDQKVDKLRALLETDISPLTNLQIHQDIHGLLVKKERYLDKKDAQPSLKNDSGQVENLRVLFEDWKKENLIIAEESGLLIDSGKGYEVKLLGNERLVKIQCLNYCTDFIDGNYNLIDKDSKKLVGKAFVKTKNSAVLTFNKTILPPNQLDLEKP